MITNTNNELCLIVPTYNEKENLPVLVERIHKSLEGYGYDYQIIVVDDNSPDGTAEIARELAGKYPIKTFCRKNERGLSSAVIAGFNQSEGKIIGAINADLQHPPEVLPQLLQAIHDGADIAIGSRYIPGGGIKGWSFKRKVMSKVATMLAGLALPSIRKIKDPMSGFYLLKKEVIQDVNLKPIGYKILLEILARGKANEVREMPYTFKPRVSGKSKLSLGVQINYLKQLFHLIAAKGELIRFLKFCLVGSIGVVVNMSSLWFFTEAGNLPYLLSYVIGIELAITNNFLWNSLWTFRDKVDRILSITTIKSWLKFNTSRLMMIIVGLSIMTLLTEVAGFYYLVSNLFAIGVITFLNYLISRHWIWK